MKIPNTWRKKALIIIDVQEWFIIDRNKYILKNIKNIIQNIDYDLIIYSITYNKIDSLWFKQIWWCEESNEMDTLNDIKIILDNKQNVYKVRKLTRSIWKSDTNIIKILKDHKIEEVHLTWYESNDCVLASTFESFDNWYYTFAIEEAIETRTTAENDIHAKKILNYLNLTNNSNFVWKDNINYYKL